jgi:acetylglutamate kinase
VITVVKLGGRVQSDPKLVDAITAVRDSGSSGLCIVHGGGDEISTLQRALGREPTFVNGRRITSEGDVDLVRMVLSGSANKRLVAALSAGGLPAVGISGEDASLLAAEPIEGLGRSGRPVSADPALLETLLNSGFLPVISPVAFDKTQPGATLNVNGDDAAAVIAAALGAELLLIADVAGVLDARKNVVQSLEPSEVDAMVNDGTVNSGMRAKLEAGFDALTRGAASVRIGGIDALYNRECGTQLSLTPSMK